MNRSYQIWVGFILCNRKLWNERLKLVFEYKITYWICVLVLSIYKSYFVVKKLVWNVRIKAFWYTKGFFIGWLVKELSKLYKNSTWKSTKKLWVPLSSNAHNYIYSFFLITFLDYLYAHIQIHYLTNKFYDSRFNNSN